MANHAQHFQNAGFSETQAVVLGEKFASLESRIDRLEQRMDRLEQRLDGVQQELHTLQRTLLYGLPALFIAQTGVMGLIGYYISRAVAG